MKPVALILDPEFGQQLGQIAQEMPAWILSSPLNDAAVDEVRRKFKGGVSITSFIPWHADDRVANSVQALYDIDEHHGPCSASDPYDELRVFGARPMDLSLRVIEELGLVRAEPSGGALVFKKRPGARVAVR